MQEICKELRKFDQVSRMAIPPQFRDYLAEDGGVLVKSVQGDRCLILFPYDEWLRYSARVKAAYSGKAQARAERMLADRSERLRMDNAGRVTIKDDFRAFAALGEFVLVVGVGSRIELWDPDEWDRYNAAVEDEPIDLSEISYSTVASEPQI